MSEKVKKEFEKQVQQINKDLSSAMKMAEDNVSVDLLKMQIDCVRILVDYCEELAIHGESAIDKWILKN